MRNDSDARTLILRPLQPNSHIAPIIFNSTKILSFMNHLTLVYLLGILENVQRSAKRLVRGCEKFLPFLPGPAWLLINKICTPFSRSLYIVSQYLIITVSTVQEHIGIG